MHEERSSLFGLTGYYRRFIKDYSKIAYTATQFWKKHNSFQWSGDSQLAFDRLKKALTDAPVLICPHFDKQFIVSTDALLKGLEAVQEQMMDDSKRLRLAQYAGVTLRKALQNYIIMELECLQLFGQITIFRHYLTLRPFKPITDHSALKYILVDKGNVLTGPLAC